MTPDQIRAEAKVIMLLGADIVALQELLERSHDREAEWIGKFHKYRTKIAALEARIERMTVAGKN